MMVNKKSFGARWETTAAVIDELITFVFSAYLQIHTILGINEIARLVASRECWLHSPNPHHLGGIRVVCTGLPVYWSHPTIAVCCMLQCCSSRQKRRVAKRVAATLITEDVHPLTTPGTYTCSITSFGMMVLRPYPALQ